MTLKTVRLYDSGDLVSEQVIDVDDTEERNERTIDGRLDLALAALRQHVAAAKPATAAAQASAAYDATVLLARVAIGLTRRVLRRLDAAD